MTLAARLTVPIGIRTGVVLLSNGEFRYAALGLAAGQFPQIRELCDKEDPDVGFPYGVDVFPDN